VPRSESDHSSTDQKSAVASVSEVLPRTGEIAQTLTEHQFQVTSKPQILASFAVSKAWQRVR
jgi:hypothetical protein